MGRGSSKIGGAGGGAMAGGQQTPQSDEQKFIADMVESITRVIGPDDIPMSRSDLQSAVEAYAMTHPGVDENDLIDRIDSAVDAHDNAGMSVQQATATAMRSLSPSVTTPAVHPANLPSSHPISMNSVYVSSQTYNWTYGKQPSGRGNWGFNIGGQEVFFNGTFSEAKKKAIRQAAQQGVRRIEILT